MILIKNGIMVDPVSEKCQVQDFVICDGIMKEIGLGFDENQFDEVIDATGKYVAAGLIDVHVHFRDPGLTYKEDILTGAESAKRGGFTTVVSMANTKPPVDNIDTLTYIRNKGEQTGIHILPCGSITRGLLGLEKTNMEELKDAGAAGFTDDGVPVLNKDLVLDVMLEAKRLDVPLSFHEEDPAYIRNSGIHDGAIARQLDLGGASPLAEEIMVARDGLLALHTGCTINIQHISSKNSISLIKLYKALGADIYAEATPHHFSLDESAVLKYGTLAKMNPPLRTIEDREAIIEGLKDGTIDIIATDHAPHSKEEKEQEFTKAPSGIIGLETSLALGVTNLVKPGHLTISQLMKKMSYNPAKLYHLDKGYLEKGKAADIVIFDINEKYVMNAFASKSSNSPFIGTELYGKVLYTICDGKIVYRC